LKLRSLSRKSAAKRTRLRLRLQSSKSLMTLTLLSKRLVTIEKLKSLLVN